MNADMEASKRAHCTCSQGYKSGHGHSSICARFLYEDWRYWKKGVKRKASEALHIYLTPEEMARLRKTARDRKMKLRAVVVAALKQFEDWVKHDSLKPSIEERVRELEKQVNRLRKL